MNLPDEKICDIRRLDIAGFRSWLAERILSWRHDPSFAQRSRIRDIRAANPHIHRLEQELRHAATADASSTQHARLEELAREIANAGKAIEGLSRAVEEDPDRREELQRKRDMFVARRLELMQEEQELVATSPERQRLLALRQELEQVRIDTGLEREEKRLARMLTEKGRRSGRFGVSFEELACTIARERIMPLLGSGDELQMLRGVKLGAAGTEIDIMIVRAGEPVDVMAIVEAKRNINDIAHGFLQRQVNIAWLKGARDRYSADDMRTRSFPTGHFDRPAIHRQGDREYIFTAESFARFHRDPVHDFYLDGLWLVTRDGPMWGLSGAALSAIAYRIATDPHWNPSDDAYMESLYRWCRAKAGRIEAPEVLRVASIIRVGGEHRAQARCE